MRDDEVEGVAPILALVAVEDVVERAALRELPASEHETLLVRLRDTLRVLCPVPLTVRGTQTLVSFAPLAFKLFYAARQNAVLRRSPFPPP